MSEERLDVAAWYPDLVAPLTAEQVEAVEKYLVVDYVATGRRPDRVEVQDAIDVTTGRRSAGDVIAEALAQGRAWATEQEQPTA